MKKIVVFDERAFRELDKLDKEIQEEFKAIFIILQDQGRLSQPDAKKLGNNLFEVRVRIKTAWRAFYAYIGKTEIIILHIFQKQTQKTPENELNTALKRLKQY